MSWTAGLLECNPDCFCESRGPFGALFWSSGAYFLSSLLLYFRTRKKTLEFEFWIFCTIMLAVSSFAFHATQTLVTVALDYASIAMTLLFFPCWSRFRKLSRRKKEAGFYLLYAVLWALFLQLDQWMRVGVSLTIFTGVLVTVRKEVHRFRYHGYLLASIVIGIGSFGFFLLEETRWMCDTASLWQAHGLWHIGSATALYLYGRWRFSDQT